MTKKLAVLTGTIVGSVLTVVFGWTVGLIAGFIVSYALTPKETKHEN